MNNMRKPFSSAPLRPCAFAFNWLFRLFSALFACFACFAGDSCFSQTILFQDNFENDTLGPPPSTFLVLDGDFAVKQIDANKVLELPGAPLDTFGALFGPATNGALTISARIFGTRHGRRYPFFGLGLSGGGGYRLQVSPAKDALEIFRGDTSIASVPYKWQSGAWTILRLHLHPLDDSTRRLEGKAWTDGSPEPANWLVTIEDKSPPPAGRASLWGSPVSGTPIRFDDLVLTLQ